MLSRGVRLGIDVGKARVGVAVCDPDGILATPVMTLARGIGAAESEVSSDIAAIGELVRQRAVVEVVVGLPVDLRGVEGLAASSSRQYAEQLAKCIDPVPVVLVDERMSTVVATRRLAERGVRGKRQRRVVDQAAAVEILQGWLDARRRKT